MEPKQKKKERYNTVYLFWCKMHKNNSLRIPFLSRRVKIFYHPCKLDNVVQYSLACIVKTNSIKLY